MATANYGFEDFELNPATAGMLSMGGHDARSRAFSGDMSTAIGAKLVGHVASLNKPSPTRGRG